VAVIAKGTARFRMLVDSARNEMLADARRTEERKRAAKAAEDVRRSRAYEAEASLRRQSLEKAARVLKTQQAAIGVVSKFVERFRLDSPFIEYGSAVSIHEAQLGLKVFYRERAARRAIVVFEFRFKPSNDASGKSVGLILRPRKRFRTLEELREFLERELLRDLARAVAQAEEFAKQNDTYSDADDPLQTVQIVEEPSKAWLRKLGS